MLIFCLGVWQHIIYNDISFILPQGTKAPELFRQSGNLGPGGLSSYNDDLLESDPVEQIEGIPNHGQVAKRQKTFCPLGGQLGEPAAGAGGHNHGLELWLHLENLGDPISYTNFRRVLIILFYVIFILVIVRRTLNNDAFSFLNLSDEP